MEANGKRSDMMSDDEFKMAELPGYVKQQCRASIPNPNSIQVKGTDNATLMKLERSKSLDPTKYADFDRIKQRMPSLMSLGDWNAAAALGESCEDIKNGKWYAFQTINHGTMSCICLWLNFQEQSGRFPWPDSIERYGLREYGFWDRMRFIFWQLILHTATALFVRIEFFSSKDPLRNKISLFREENDDFIIRI